MTVILELVIGAAATSVVAIAVGVAAYVRSSSCFGGLVKIDMKDDGKVGAGSPVVIPLAGK